MGVPAFFRWLTKKYPSVIVHCIEEKNKNIDGVEIPLDLTQPNPNGVEFDNLYLDMNGIIHPCTHPEDKPPPQNEDEMMVAIFECIDRLFRIVRPRKLLYMAIDGVAPRAKMNQQRSRRFRASKEAYEKQKEMDRVREDLISRGLSVPPEKPKGSHFDSNCITPGTPFMDRLSKCLHYYVHDRLNNDPAWRNIKVILSDANVPGEGEHKIMDFIRRQRAKPDHDPNTAHVLCGADADLIMLGLATHEPNFTIIREEFKPNKPRPCDLCGQLGHEMKDCMGLEKERSGEHDEIAMPFAAEVEFIFVRINVLREYLEKELTMPNLPFPFELERAIDDWVFMCFFVGNDFLPHLPSLEIRENAIDRLVQLYKKTVYKTGGWVTDSGVANLQRVQLIVQELGEVEDIIFQQRQENEKKFKARMKANKKRKRLEDANCYGKPAYLTGGQFTPTAPGHNPNPLLNVRQEAHNMRVQGMHTNKDGSFVNANKNAAAALRSMLRMGESESPNTSLNSSLSDTSPAASPSEGPVKRKASTVFDSDSEEEPNDEVRLWEDGFKDRYYESKFDVKADNIEFRHRVGHEYVRGLCWVLRYYYQGCASWEWYFPYHYAPFASDFVNISDLSTEFERDTKPFSPLEQLMGVFPAASKSHVPEPWGRLMEDPDSPIIDFYPDDFQIDLNGKKYAWQGVALLPFVDEKRLKMVLEPYYKDLTNEELRRNVRGDDRLYVRKPHASYDFLEGLYENAYGEHVEVVADHKMFEISGRILVSQDVVAFKGTLKSPIADLIDVVENEVITVKYRDPAYDPGFLFPAIRLENAVDPPKVLKPGNLSEEESRNWRPQIGMARATTRASLDASAHRSLAHHGYDRNDRNQPRGVYSNMPPPINSSYPMQQGYRSYNSQDRDQSRGSYSRGGGGNNWRNSNSNSQDRYGGGNQYGNNDSSRYGGSSNFGGGYSRGGGGGGGNSGGSYGYSSRSDSSSNNRSGGSHQSRTYYNSQQQQQYGSGPGPNQVSRHGSGGGSQYNNTSNNWRGSSAGNQYQQQQQQQRGSSNRQGYFTSNYNGNQR